MQHAGLTTILTLLLAAAAAAQTAVALPNGTGNLTVPDGWTVLSAADNAAETRASDPTEEPARSLLLGTLAILRQNNRTDQNLILHQAGTATGQLRLINAYSADVATTSEHLQERDSIEQIRDAFEEMLTQPGVDVVFHGESKPDLFPVGCVTLTFRIDGQNGSMFDRLTIVPAGERLQYFESISMKDDLDAQTAIDSVLTTFDGAEEAPPDDVLKNMVIGGLAGAFAGIAVAMLRRRRLQRAARTAAN